MDTETQKMMDNTDISDMRPDQICSACARKALIHNPSGYLAAYCQHTETGAYKYPGRGWEISPAGYPPRMFKGDVLAHLLAIDHHLNQSDARDDQGEH